MKITLNGVSGNVWENRRHKVTEKVPYLPPKGSQMNPKSHPKSSQNHLSVLLGCRGHPLRGWGYPPILKSHENRSKIVPNNVINLQWKKHVCRLWEKNGDSCPLFFDVQALTLPHSFGSAPPQHLLRMPHGSHTLSATTIGRGGLGEAQLDLGVQSSKSVN